MLADLRTSLRQLLRSPVFTVAALLTLTLSIAAGTTVFSVYNAAVYRPSHTVDWENVFSVYQASAHETSIEPAQVRALHDNTPAGVRSIASSAWRPVVLQRQQRAVKTYAEVVDGDLATTFRIRPRIGRLLDRRDEAAGVRSAVVSATLWNRWFGGREAVNERDSVQINGVEFQVVGVMPIGVGFFSVDVWVAAAAGAPVLNADPRWARLPWRTYIRTDTAIDPADVSRLISAATAHVHTASGVQGVIARRSRGWRAAGDAQIFGITALLLVAACANLTNLVYARVTQRRSEIAVRLALGAGRLRVVRTFVLEIVAITLVAAAAGYALAEGATALIERAFPSFQQNEWGTFVDLSPDIRVVIFVAASAVAVAATLSVIVATTLARVPAARALAASAGVATTGTAGRRFRYALVSLQVTVAVVLVLGAGLWLLAARRSLDRTIDPFDVRYDTSRLAMLRLDMAFQKYSATRGAVVHARALAAAAAVPGIESAALTSGLPGAEGSRNEYSPPGMYFIVDTGTKVLSGRPRTAQGYYAAASDGLLETLGLRLLAGRHFRANDVDGAPLVVLVSETVAAMLFPSGDALGSRLLFNTDKRPREIVGIFQDPLVSARERWMVAHNILVLVPIAQQYHPEMMVVTRTAEPDAAAEAVASGVAALDPELAIFDATSVEQALLTEAAPYRAATRGMALLGVLSLLFAALGIYGVMSFFVSTRVREFGIRLAVGATPRALLRYVFAEARLLLLVGLLCGVFLMAVVERLLDHRIARMMPNAVEMWIAAIALVLVTGLIATYFPARRASRTDPLVALREL